MEFVGSKQKPHAVLIPFPTQGHITPFMQLATLLHSKGFHITFVNTEFNHRRLTRSKGSDFIKGLPDFRFETIPDGLTYSDSDATQDPSVLCDSVRKHCLAPFKQLLFKLNRLSVPRISCIISDGVMGWAIKAADEFGIPEIQFWTASACSFMAYLHFTQLLDRDIIPFKGDNFTTDGTLDTPIDWIPGMPDIRLKDMPSFIHEAPAGVLFDFLSSEAQNCLNSSAIIFNTYDEFEDQVLEAIKAKFPNIYTIGPLALLLRQLRQKNQFTINSTSLWKEYSNCIEWLDKREVNSVVYVNYGSITTMTEKHLREFAWGLANSKHPFLWIVRPDVVSGGDVDVGLPEEFLGEIKDRGLLASWCPQAKVLAHPAVGLFLTHCGWNSIMETVSVGVPVMCWPFFADQQTNTRYCCTTWDIGTEVNHDVQRKDIQALVKEMLEGDGGKRRRQNALEWQQRAMNATDVGGSSYNNFDRFIKNMSASTDTTLTFPSV